MKKTLEAQKKVSRDSLTHAGKLISGKTVGRKKLEKTLNAQKKVIQDVTKEVARLFTGCTWAGKADLSRIRFFFWDLRDGFVEVLKRVLIILVMGILGLVYLLSPIDILPDFIPVIGILDDFGVVGVIVYYWFTRRLWMVAILIFIIPLVVGLLLGLIFPPLGIIAGIAAMVFGFWKVGTDPRYFD